MNDAEILRFAIDAVDAEHIPYFVVGSYASSYYGEPRFTQDLDLAIWLGVDSKRVLGLCDRFPSPDFYVNVEAARAAAAEGGQFNILHSGAIFKIDFMILENSVYDRNRRARARTVKMPDVGEIMIAAPEDVIIKKLVYAKEGRAETHLRDIASMLKRRGDEIDCDDITKWAAHFGVTEYWQAVCDKLDSGDTVR